MVYSRVGGGHQSAAQALLEAFEAAGGGLLTARAVDLYLDQSRFPISRFPAIYSRLARDHPRLWGALFRFTDGRWHRDPRGLLRPFTAEKMGRLLGEERPDLLVSVLPVVNGLLSELLAARSPRPRFEVVLTDWYAIHRAWVAPGVDHYTVPTEPAGLDCIRYGVASTAVEVQGLPVRSEFTAAPPTAAARMQLRAELGLAPERFTILAMVGAEGSPRALEQVRTLARLELDAQVVVVCGRNARLKREVEALPARLPLQALGFVENIAALMRSADLLVTKAGGVTLAEAFCCGVPVVVHDVLPGQEAGNVTYALQHGAVEQAPTTQQLAVLVTALRAAPERRAALAAAARALARPEAARRIAAAMLARLGAD